MYVKLHSDILDSSIWCEDSETRIVWITMLAMADQEGLVKATAPGISNRARVSLKKTIKALTLMELPDEHSKTLDDEGRRIERVNGGYRILNYVFYRNAQSREQFQEANRERQRRWREKQKTSGSVTESNDKSQGITLRNVTETLLSQQAEADSEAEASKINPLPSQSQKPKAAKVETLPLAGVGDGDETARAIQAAWNKASAIVEARGETLRPFKALTKARRREIATRLKDPWWRDNWQAGIEMIPKCPKLTGAMDGKFKDWVATPEWFFEEKNLVKIIEGQYLDHTAEREAAEAKKQSDCILAELGFGKCGNAV